jgi:hypothetical protein
MTTSPSQPPPEPPAGQDDPPELRAVVLAVLRLLADLNDWHDRITDDQHLRIRALLRAVRRFREANRL